MLRRSLSDRGENRDPGVAIEVTVRVDHQPIAQWSAGSGRTAVLIVSLLIVDIKPGVYDAPLRGFGA
jgi:hypothetical protein